MNRLCQIGGSLKRVACRIVVFAVVFALSAVVTAVSTTPSVVNPFDGTWTTWLQARSSAQEDEDSRQAPES